MLYVPIELVRAGMVLAKSIDADIGMGHIPLVTRGQVLTDRVIHKLVDKCVSGIYIETDFSDDIEVRDVLRPAIKHKALVGIQKVFEDLSKNESISMSNASRITDIARELVIEILSNDDVLIDFLDLKGYDDYTCRHSLSVAIFGISIGRILGYSNSILTEIATSALLHDVGKTQIPIELINKPGRLTEDEYNIIKEHPAIAADRLRDKPKISDAVIKGILTHHERHNGTGYPNGLKGDEIPVYGRILAISDVYDALTSQRPYRKAWYPNEAIEYLLGCNGVQFSPDIIDAFLKIVVPYPIGTVLELSNGCIAVVIKENENKLRPVVRLFSADDDAPFNDIDMMHDKSYMNVTIGGLGYKSDKINYQAFATANTNEGKQKRGPL